MSIPIWTGLPVAQIEASCERTTYFVVAGELPNVPMDDISLPSTQTRLAPMTMGTWSVYSPGGKSLIVRRYEPTPLIGRIVPFGVRWPSQVPGTVMGKRSCAGCAASPCHTNIHWPPSGTGVVNAPQWANDTVPSLGFGES